MGIASANNVDFMIKGVFKFQAFGQELWVTTTEIGLSIVTIVILLIAIVTNVKMKKRRKYRAHSRISWNSQ